MSTAAQGRYIVPRFTERTSQGIREYDPYSKLFEERIVLIGSAVDHTAANDIMAQLLCLEAADPDRDISLYINSAGGDITALYSVYDTMQFVKPDIQTVCIGQAISVAAVLLAGGTKGKRIALPHSRILLQQPHSQGRRGQVSDLEVEARDLIRMRERVEGLLAKHSNREVEQIRQDIERDNVLTAQEALEFGLVDHIVAPRDLDARS
ncbi:ATP-dependent Clp protease proteolytic subunit [Streptomyces sp. FH025]|uniref:ATP-dependent Clp protease proteolytic subunit n=1 Tax=Streptomyces sp. FH025 TaxID=2815937 RepID=UPI001A9E3B3E|nr:ATP-dependent Clp protease proteolytic subunit [Streptomyces sp. FH025]MBO1414058.1 ATP-dependent Clp protease proteolytic subunit [Streptomyces sp. FH025]